MVDGERAGVAEQERMAVRLRLDDVQRGDIAAEAGTVIEFDRRAEARPSGACSGCNDAVLVPPGGNAMTILIGSTPARRPAVRTASEPPHRAFRAQHGATPGAPAATKTVRSLNVPEVEG